jgi:hypothetical protein
MVHISYENPFLEVVSYEKLFLEAVSYENPVTTSTVYIRY